MAKSAKSKAKAQTAAAPVVTGLKTVYDLREDFELWYKIKVLVYDLAHMAKDQTCERRTLQTTDELYISAPYFSAYEAAMIKATLKPSGISIERAITNELQSFFEKRRASGDCRPCGPHDMVPIYLSAFVMTKDEIEHDKFISRLRRSGLVVG